MRNAALSHTTITRLKLRFILFQPTPKTDLEGLIDELNKSFSLPGELRCGEYSFKLKMNPWQHPIFDDNIHRLFALLSSLARGCGGVVYLMADDAQTVTQEIFQAYQGRLHALIGREAETLSLLTNMVQVSLLLGTHRSWAALFLKKILCHTETHPSADWGDVETYDIRVQSLWSDICKT